VSNEDRAYVLGPQDGEATWFAGTLMVTKASSTHTEGAFSLLDQRIPAHYAAPRHIHHHDDEAWYLLDGSVTFYCGERVLDASSGAFVFLPKGVEHAFVVGEEEARLLTISAPASFADFVAAAGQPAPELVLPPPAELDAAGLAEVALRFGVTITGPPPT
jgi:mannose-6-phosphate isomerase-like protein (cupin superfamily)